MLSQIPLINAIAGMHDVFQNSFGETEWRNILNVPGMPVAATITSLATVGQPLEHFNGAIVVGRRRDLDYVDLR